MTEEELNREIAHALGWRTWDVERDGKPKWFQERQHPYKGGMIQVALLMDYVQLLREMDVPLKYDLRKSEQE